MKRGLVLIIGMMMVLVVGNVANSQMVFELHHKFAGRPLKETMVERIKHDKTRFERKLATVDFGTLGKGNLMDGIGAFFTKLSIGTPPQDYIVMLDSSRPLSFLHCKGCSKCPTKSTRYEFTLNMYDINRSSAAKKIGCDDPYCSGTPFKTMCSKDKQQFCRYDSEYDLSKGYFVTDKLNLNLVSGDEHRWTETTDIVFGCGMEQSGYMTEPMIATDGVFGLSPSNISLVSQLAVSKLVKREFAHCFDNQAYGGILAVGEVLEPKVKTTPIVRNETEYQVSTKAVEIDGKILDFPPEVFKTSKTRGTVIECSTIYSYLPPPVYNIFKAKVGEKDPRVKWHIVEEDIDCFFYRESLSIFPTVTLHMKGGLKLTVHPHQYLVKWAAANEYCLGLMNSKTLGDDWTNFFIIGELHMYNHLFVYDLEEETVGWTDYNCSSGIKVEGLKKGTSYDLKGHVLDVDTPTITSATPTSNAVKLGKFPLLLVLSAILSFLAA